MEISGPAKQLTVYIGETDRFHRQPLYLAIIERLRAEGLAGATAWKGTAGFGANSRIHTAHILQLSRDLPVVIEVVDREDRLRSGLAAIEGMVFGGLMILQDVEVVHYREAS